MKKNAYEQRIIVIGISLGRTVSKTGFTTVAPGKEAASVPMVSSRVGERIGRRPRSKSPPEQDSVVSETGHTSMALGKVTQTPHRCIIDSE